MKPGGDPEADRLWRVVAATVRPLPGRTAPAPPERLIVRAGEIQQETVRRSAATETPRAARVIAGASGPEMIEPGRRRRLMSERDRIAARLDLHGMTQDGARSALTAFLIRGFAQGQRSVLVITGKGTLGDGVLRRRVPEWLAEPPLRPLIAGVSEAHRRHGGAGALYVVLRRQSPG